MTGQSELATLRFRLVAVLWDRLAELEADATREAIWRRTDWDTIGDPCPRCGELVVRFRDGVCIQCAEKLVEQADRKERLRQRFLRLMKAHNARVDKRKRRGPARAGPPQQHRSSIEG